MGLFSCLVAIFVTFFNIILSSSLLLFSHYEFKRKEGQTYLIKKKKKEGQTYKSSERNTSEARHIHMKREVRTEST